MYQGLHDHHHAIYFILHTCACGCARIRFFFGFLGFSLARMYGIDVSAMRFFLLFILLCGRAVSSRAHSRDLRYPRWFAFSSSWSVLSSPCGLTPPPMGPPRTLLPANFRLAYTVRITMTPPPPQLNPSPSFLTRCSCVYARIFVKHSMP
jgi:hypothetical protein